MKKLHNYLPSIWTNVYEDDPAPGAPPADPPKVADPPKADPPADPSFGQADVDRIVKGRLRKHEEELKKTLTEMNALRARADLTQEERHDWEKRVEQLNDTLLSKEEMAEKAAQKAREQHEQKVNDMGNEISLWKDRFTDSTIKRSLQDAAIQHKAFYPEQIVSILDRDTRLVEELIDGKPSGRLVPRVRFADVDKEGKPVTLELAPEKAIERMTEIGKYQNLFEGSGTGGLGRRSHPDGGKKQSLAQQAQSPKSWIEGRRDGSISLD